MVKRSLQASVDLPDILVGKPPVFSAVTGKASLVDEDKMSFFPTSKPLEPNLFFAVVSNLIKLPGKLQQLNPGLGLRMPGEICLAKSLGVDQTALVGLTWEKVVKRRNETTMPV